MPTWTREDVAEVVAAAHADSLAAEVERYLAAVVAFDDEGVAPFGAVRARAAVDRRLPASG